MVYVLHGYSKMYVYPGCNGTVYKYSIVVTAVLFFKEISMNYFYIHLKLRTFKKVCNLPLTELVRYNQLAVIELILIEGERMHLRLVDVVRARSLCACAIWMSGHRSPHQPHRGVINDRERSRVILSLWKIYNDMSLRSRLYYVLTSSLILVCTLSQIK